MMRSLFAGVSSLKAHQTRMDVIGNNIANVNTVGFKSSRVTFSDMLSQTSSGASAPSTNLGGINPKQIGLGASVESVDLVFTDGSPQNSGKNTDIALSGNGLFVLKNGDSYYYSRDGAFEFDTNGNYVMPGSGLYVQGWNASDGVLNTNGTTENIVVRSGQTMPGTATTAVTYASNLNAAEPTITNITYTAGSTNAKPSDVINYKQVTRYSVAGATEFTYDPRVMTLSGDMELSTVDTVTYRDENGNILTNVTDANGNALTTATTVGTVTIANSDISLTAGTTYAVGGQYGDSEDRGNENVGTVYVDGVAYDNATATTSRANQISVLPTYTVTKTVKPTADDIAGTTTNATTYSLTLSDDSVVQVTSLDGYAVDDVYPEGATTTITALNTTETSTTPTSILLTLSDGSTQSVGFDEAGYTIGGTYPAGAGTTIEKVEVVANVATTINGGTPTTTMETIAAYPDGDSSVNADSFTITGTDNTNTTIVLTYNDGSTNTAVAGTSYTIGVDDTGSVSSINVDGTNVIAATLTLSDGSTQKVTSGFYQINHGVPVTTVVTVYDSEGQAHAVSLLIDKNNSTVDNEVNNDALALARVLDDNGNTITGATIVKYNKDAGGNIISYDYTYTSGTETKTATAYADHVVWDNRWSVFMAPGEGQKGPVYSYEVTEADGTKTTGYLNYTEDDAGNVFGKPSYVYFNDDGSYSASATANASLYLIYSNGNGAAPTTANVDFSNVTQYAGSTTAYGSTDGNAYGILQSVAIDSAGIITGTYSNGVLRTEAQIAVAQFVNSAGLTKTGTSLYQQSNNSGEANIKTLDAFGLSITPSALEMSNVELASELADMIVTQRGFQSNSKIITVADEMLETIINMKR